MKQELIDFIHFKENQLTNFNIETGQLDVITQSNRKCTNIGSINSDGYTRVWCNGSLRMKHRLIYWLIYNCLPREGYEVDHIDFNRSNNKPNNLRILSKSKNNAHKAGPKPHGKQMTDEQVHLVCSLLQNTKLADQTIADKVGRSRSIIRDIKKRRRRIKIGKEYSWNHRE